MNEGKKMRQFKLHENFHLSMRLLQEGKNCCKIGKGGANISKSVAKKWLMFKIPKRTAPAPTKSRERGAPMHASSILYSTSKGKGHRKLVKKGLMTVSFPACHSVSNGRLTRWNCHHQGSPFLQGTSLHCPPLQGLPWHLLFYFIQNRIQILYHISYVLPWPSPTMSDSMASPSSCLTRHDQNAIKLDLPLNSV